MTVLVMAGLSPVNKVEIGPNHTIIGFDNSSLRIYDIRNHKNPIHTIQVVGITCGGLSGGNFVALGTANGTLCTYDITTGAFTSNQVHNQEITCLQSLNAMVATGSTDKTVKVFDMTSQSVVKTLVDHTGPVWTLQMDQHKLVSGGADMCMKVWSVSSGTRQYSLLGGSLQERGNNTQNPRTPGCSGLKFDTSKIVGVFNSLLRVYSFAVDE